VTSIVCILIVLIIIIVILLIIAVILKIISSVKGGPVPPVPPPVQPQPKPKPDPTKEKKKKDLEKRVEKNCKTGNPMNLRRCPFDPDNDPQAVAARFFRTKCERYNDRIDRQNRGLPENEQLPLIELGACLPEIVSDTQKECNMRPGVQYHCYLEPILDKDYNISVICCYCCHDDGTFDEDCKNPHWGSTPIGDFLGNYPGCDP
jgi:hypothetical protein